MARSFQGCPGALYMSAVLVWATVLYCSVCANLCSAQVINDGALVLVSTPTELQQTLNLRNLTANVLVRDHLNMVGSPQLREPDSTVFYRNAVVRTSAFAKSIVVRIYDSMQTKVAFIVFAHSSSCYRRTGQPGYKPTHRATEIAHYVTYTCHMTSNALYTAETGP